MILKTIFWLCFAIIFHTFLGYGLLIAFLIRLRKLLGIRKKTGIITENYEPEVTLFVTAFNEKDYVNQKVRNSFELDYPKEKVKYLWVTDGSDDGTPELLKKYSEIEVHHQPERRGKIHAMNRGMKFVKTPIVIFSDTNTILGNDSIRVIVDKFKDSMVGCVAGEKRIITDDKDNAVGSGEGFYWKMESKLKQLDAEFHTVVGAAGELFAVRTELFHEVENDTLLDDFIISLRIAKQGYRIEYDPNAYAAEKASLNVHEEMKRKIRITAGGFQSIVRLKELLNIFKYGKLSFQYISRKMLRWSVVPSLLVIIFLVNLLILFENNSLENNNFYAAFFLLQGLFYTLAFLGKLFQSKKVRYKFLFIPYYFVEMNYATFPGFIRYRKGNQSVNWEKAKRA